MYFQLSIWTYDKWFKYVKHFQLKILILFFINILKYLFTQES